MFASLINQFKLWQRGIRLYIAALIGLVTIESAWWAQTTYGGSSLVSLRLEEIYAWLALGFLGLAILIGPVYKIFPNLPAKFVLRDGRRLIGIGAAWFAALHAGIAYFVLFKAPNPLALPASYQRSFAVGGLALIILLALALTSFDRAFRGMGSWWFRLHRTVYVATILSLLHAFIDGVHADGWPALVILTICAASLIGLHGYIRLVKPAHPTLKNIVWLSGVLLVLIAVLGYGYSQRLGYNPFEGRNEQRQE